MPRPARRRNLKRKPWRKPGMRRSIRKPNVYSYKRSIYTQSFAVASAAGNQIGYQGLLSTLPNANEFQALYDQYMIKKIVFKLIPRGFDTNVVQGGVTNAGFNIHSAIDYDDGNVPTGPNDLLQYQSYRCTPGNRTHTRVWVPKTVSGINNNVGVLVGAGAKAYQWIDVAQPNVPHFGLKMYIDPTNSVGQQMPFDAVITYYLSFKCVR